MSTGSDVIREMLRLDLRQIINRPLGLQIVDEHRDLMHAYPHTGVAEIALVATVVFETLENCTHPLRDIDPPRIRSRTDDMAGLLKVP